MTAVLDEAALRAAYDAGTSRNALAVIHGVAPATIHRHLHRTGTTRSKAAAGALRARERNGADYFDVISSEARAYWFGFIVADGCVAADGTLTVALAPKDGDHVRRLASLFDAPVHERWRGGKSPEVNASLGRVAGRVLMAKGVCPRKSSAVDLSGVLDHVPVAFWRHFLRGLLDGDGWAFVNQRGGVTIGVCGNVPLLRHLRDHAHDVLGVNRVAIVGAAGSPFGQFKWAGRADVLLLRDWLYADASVWLPRKRDTMDILRPRDGAAIARRAVTGATESVVMSRPGRTESAVASL